MPTGAGTTYERRFFTYDPFGRMTAVHSDSGRTVLIAEYRYNGLGQRIMWRYDQNSNGTVASTERFFYMYDDRWRMVGAFWDSGSTPQESFVYHAAGNAGRGSSSYIDSIVMRDRDANGGGGWTGDSDGTLIVGGSGFGGQVTASLPLSTSPSSDDTSGSSPRTVRQKWPVSVSPSTPFRLLSLWLFRRSLCCTHLLHRRLSASSPVAPSQRLRDWVVAGLRDQRKRHVHNDRSHIKF